MRDSIGFKRYCGVLLALICAGFAGTAGAVAGRVDFTMGSAIVSGIDGRERPLAKGAELDNGDTVRTRDGRAQIRFTDGAYVSLQPNTDFSIKEYRFDGKTDGSERGLFGLARGAMRTVTGLIGRFNRNAYQISTPTATVGIRGTGGQIEIEPDLATLVRSTSGIWYLANLAGSLDVPAGTSARAPADPNTPPRSTTEIPSTGPVQIPLRYSAGDDCAQHPFRADCSKGQPPQSPQMVSGPGFHLSFAYGGNNNCDGGDCSGISSAGPDVANFNSSSQLTGYGTPPAPPNKIFNFSGAQHREGGFRDGIVAWGRFTGTVGYSGPFQQGLPGNFGSNEGFHYIVGLPTAVATMPSTTGSIPFTFVDATSPTLSNGVLPPGVFSNGIMNVNFLSGVINVSGQVLFGTSGYSFSAPGSIVPGTARFSGVGGPGSASTFGTIIGSLGGCDAPCSFAFNGAFFGSGAAFAGWSYRIIDIGGSILGVVVFKKP